MNNVIKTIYDRRAVRKYQDTPVERNLISEVIQAGCMAPSAINKQPWKFYVLTDKDQIRFISKSILSKASKEMKNIRLKDSIKTALSFFHLSNMVSMLMNGDPIFHGAPVVIFVTSPKNDSWGPLDIGMCAQNMMLAAKSLGLDTCPVGFAKMIEKTESYPMLHIPDQEEIQLAIVMGYGDEMPKMHERVPNTTVYLDSNKLFIR